MFKNIFLLIIGVGFFIQTGIIIGDEGEADSSISTTVQNPIITMQFKSLVADADYEPEEGRTYEISLIGEDKSNLKFVFKKIKPYVGDVRIYVQTLNTPCNRFLFDNNNPGLFNDEEGEVGLEIIVPSGWPFFLAEYAEGPYGNPCPLSNIIQVP